MRTIRNGLCLLVALVLTGCAGTLEGFRPWGATPQQASVIQGQYRAPDRGVSTTLTTDEAAPRDTVLRATATRARAAGLNVTDRDDAQGFVVARYSGPPEDLIDCGQVLPTAANARPLAVQTLTANASAASGGASVQQRMHLDSRLTTRVDRRGDGAATATVGGSYVVRREQTVTDANGAVIQRTREFIDFETDGAARFRDGVTCVATGKLEQALLAGGRAGVGS